MKISEKLAILKQKEGELLREYDLKESVVKQGFDDTIKHLESGKISEKRLEDKKKTFMKDKKKRIEQIDVQIDKLKKELIAGKNKINKRNVEIGIDLKLIEIKYVRIELSKLMNLVKKDRYSLRIGMELEDYDILNVSKKIQELEKRKTKLDSEIQSLNWSTNL